MPSNSETVKEFFNACNSRDIDFILDFFTEDAVWTNIPIDPPNKGKDQIRAFLRWFYNTFDETEFVIRHQIESADGLVMNERIDWLGTGGKRLALPVMGVFELRDGKISEWRDYFDKGAFGG